MTEEAGYVFEFTLTPEESASARRRVLHFCMGEKSGARWHIAFGLMAAVLTVMGIPVFIDLDEPALLGYGFMFGVFLLLALSIKALDARKRIRALMTSGAPARVFIGENGIRMTEGGETREMPWMAFTALLETSQVYVVMTVSAHLVIPMRAVAPELVEGFETYTRSRCLKQGPMWAFPVIVEAEKQKT